MTDDTQQESEQQQTAIRELSAAGVPFVEDQLEGIGPMGCLWYAYTAVEETMRHWAAELSAIPAEEAEALAALSVPLGCVQAAYGSMVEACVQSGILPPEAMEGVS